MSAETRTPQSPVWRLGRRPDPWAPPDWAFAQEDGTFGNRFDDPQGLYRVLYASSSRLGCYVETLARFRPDLRLIAELEEIEGENDFYPLGVVPPEWLENRLMGSADAAGNYADLYAAGWVGELRLRLAPECLKLGLPDLDLAALENARPRRLTQLASRIVFERRYPGICYSSRYGHDLENWALFEPFEHLISRGIEEPRQNDPDLIQACGLLRVRFGTQGTIRTE
jgi:hypothetical protein